MDDDDLNAFGNTNVGIGEGDEVLGRFRLKEKLGSGGMGMVWLGKDTALDRLVALKLLPEILLCDDATVSELKAETKVGLKLTHKNIMRVIDFAKDSKLAAIVMEYIDGATLSAMRLDQPNRVFEGRSFEPYLRQILDALEYAHEAVRVIHRDLKPANLMVDSSDQLKVTDFGIACCLRESASRVTIQPRSAAGTLLYMSPQQILGKAASESDDIYSLGATLFELLAGSPPFRGGDVPTQIREIKPPSIAERREEDGIEGEEIPAVWEEIVAACLEKEREDRPLSATEIRKALDGKPFSKGVRAAPKKATKPKPAAAPPAQVTQSLPAPARQGISPNLLIGIAAGFIALLAVGFFAINGAKKKDDEQVDTGGGAAAVKERLERESQDKQLADFVQKFNDTEDEANLESASALDQVKLWDVFLKETRSFDYPHSRKDEELKSDAKDARQNAYTEAQNQTFRYQFTVGKLGEDLSDLKSNLEDLGNDHTKKTELCDRLLANWNDSVALDEDYGTLHLELEKELIDLRNEHDQKAAEIADRTPGSPVSRSQFFAAKHFSGWSDYGKNQLLKQVQGMLNSAGHNVGAVDGAYGTNTFNGTFAYQQAKGIDPSGCLDDPTLLSMGLASAVEQKKPRYTSRSGGGSSNSGSNSNSNSKSNGWSDAIKERISSGGSLPNLPGF